MSESAPRRSSGHCIDQPAVSKMITLLRQSRRVRPLLYADILTPKIYASCRKRTPADDFPQQMLLLSLEILQRGELPELAVGGAWCTVETIMNRVSVALGVLALEADMCGIAVAQLRSIGAAADWIVSLFPPHARREVSIILELTISTSR